MSQKFHRALCVLSIEFIWQASDDFIKKNYVHILALLSQLRQACNHPSLLKGKQSFPHSLRLAKQLPAEITANVFENIERGVAKCTICRVSKLFTQRVRVHASKFCFLEIAAISLILAIRWHRLDPFCRSHPWMLLHQHVVIFSAVTVYMMT